MVYETAVRFVRRRSTPRESPLSDTARAAADGLAYPQPHFTAVRAPRTISSRANPGYEFGGETFSFGKTKVLLLALAVGVIGGIYSVGGGALIAPFLVAFFRLPVYTVAGATLLATLVTSVAGVAFFQAMSVSDFIERSMVAPDWSLGILLGIGGLAGGYLGARLQRYLPEFLIKATLALLVTGLALRYLLV
jgi:uncharacterized membrane protein YfcA